MKQISTIEASGKPSTSDATNPTSHWDESRHKLSHLCKDLPTLADIATTKFHKTSDVTTP